MSPSEVMDAHLRSGIAAWDHNGACPTFLWAVGKDRTAFATPALPILGADPKTVLVLLGRIAEAWIIGRTDEAWLKETPNKDEHSRIRVTNLAGMLEHDPNSRTAIVVQGSMIAVQRRYLTFAAVSMDDDGFAEWQTHSPEDMQSESFDEIDEAAALLAVESYKSGDHDDFMRLAEACLQEWGWAVVVDPLDIDS